MDAIKYLVNFGRSASPSVLFEMLKSFIYLPFTLGYRSLALAIRLFLYLSLFLAVSVVIYGAMYLYFVPTIQHLEPLYFDFDEARPTASALFKPRDSERYRYSDEELGDEHVNLLRNGQKYDIFLQMWIREVDKGDIGNIMAELGVYDTLNAEIAASKRPMYICKKSTPLWVLDKLIKLPLLLFGRDLEVIRIRMPMMENFIDIEEKPIAKCTAEISSNGIEIQYAAVEIMAHLTGVQYYLHDWFYTTMFLIIAALTSALFNTYLLYAFFRLIFGSHEQEAKTDQPLKRFRKVSLGQNPRRNPFARVIRIDDEMIESDTSSDREDVAASPNQLELSTSSEEEDSDEGATHVEKKNN